MADFLYEYWYIACRSSELQIKKPLKRQILDEHLVFFREQDGQAGALLDRCPHRNLALSRGQVTKNGLQCAYHGWTYNREGECTVVPAQCSSSPRSTHMRSFPVKESQGFVWVFMTARKAARKSNKQFLPAHDPIQFPLYEDSRARHWVMERVFEGNALHCAENFLDVPHTVFVHAGIFRNKSGKELEYKVTAGREWVQAEFFDEGAFDTFLGRLLIPGGVQMIHTDRFMLPSITRVDYYFTEKRNFIVMSQCTPITATATRVFTYMAFRFDPFAWLVQKIFEPLANRILDQDVVVIKQQTEDMLLTGAPSFLFHPTDAIGREIFQLVHGKQLKAEIRRARIRI